MLFILVKTRLCLCAKCTQKEVKVEVGGGPLGCNILKLALEIVPPTFMMFFFLYI